MSQIGGLGGFGDSRKSGKKMALRHFLDSFFSEYFGNFE